jgi:hypothetical protein
MHTTNRCAIHLPNQQYRRRRLVITLTVNSARISTAFRTTLTELPHRSISSRTRNLSLHRLIPWLHTRHQIVFQQLRLPFPFTLKKIIFLCLICNIYLYIYILRTNERTKKQQQQPMSDVSSFLSGQHCARIFTKQKKTKFRYFAFLARFAFRPLVLPFFILYQTVIGMHIYTISLCAIEPSLLKQKPDL